MELLNQYFNLQKQIHDYFGYEEDWKVIPLDDGTDYYWHVTDEESGVVYFAEDEDTLRKAVAIEEKLSSRVLMGPEFDKYLRDLEEQEVGDYYRSEIYTQRFLPKYVYRGKDYTMISVDTRTDGNKFLQVFDNSKEVKIEQTAEA